MKSNKIFIVEVLVSGIRYSKKEFTIPADVNLDEYEDEDFGEWNSSFIPDDDCDYPLKIKFSKI
jgi:hypothetical protein